MSDMSMRARFVETSVKLLETDPNVVLVLAEISVTAFGELGLSANIRDRIFNVVIREQLMVGVAAGLAKEGFLPIVHTYAPFLVERCFEQLKLDFSHHGLAGLFVIIGASYDAASSGRTHQAPADVGLVRALPDWSIFVPGHGGEVADMMRQAVASRQCAYIRLSDETNSAPRSRAHAGMSVQKHGSRDFVVVAVGPMLDRVLAAVSALDVTVLYAPSVHPFDGEGLRECGAKKVVLVEPYLAGTSAAAISAALIDQPHRLLSLGVRNTELRHYGEPHEHAAAHGLDVAGLGRSIGAFYRS
jgi:transketolase